MAKFVCTLKEFTYFIDPRIKQNITNFTKPYKNRLEHRCQKCNEQKKELDAAHKHGISRPEIIKQVLENYKKNDGNYEIIDLQKVIGEINNAHLPIENHFYFLCKKCHMEYGSGLIDLNNSESKKSKSYKTISNKISQTKKNNLIEVNNFPKEILCKKETDSWKYKLGWTSINNRKNIEELISKIESNFDCRPLAFKSWYFHKRTDNNKQFSGIICHKNNSLLCFRIEPNSFSITDNRIILNKRWFFSERKEGRIKILPQNYDLIMKCLSYAYDVSS